MFVNKINFQSFPLKDSDVAIYIVISKSLLKENIKQNYHIKVEFLPKVSLQCNEGGIRTTD